MSFEVLASTTCRKLPKMKHRELNELWALNELLLDFGRSNPRLAQTGAGWSQWVRYATDTSVTCEAEAARDDLFKCNFKGLLQLSGETTEMKGSIKFPNFEVEWLCLWWMLHDSVVSRIENHRFQWAQFHPYNSNVMYDSFQTLPCLACLVLMCIYPIFAWWFYPYMMISCCFCQSLSMLINPSFLDYPPGNKHGLM